MKLKRNLHVLYHKIVLLVLSHDVPSLQYNYERQIYTEIMILNTRYYVKQLFTMFTKQINQ